MMITKMVRMLCGILIGTSATLIDLNARAADAVAEIKIEPEVVVSKISPDFIGFGYETSAVAQSNFFSPANKAMVRLYRNLTTHGLIRIGGNVSDHTKFVPDGIAAPKTEREVTVINTASLKSLGKFARATGWKVMWGLNLGSGSKEEAVQEALAVDAALGKSLHSFEIGNEVDALGRFSRKYDAYHTAYLEYKAAIRAALPHAKFSGPDVIGNWQWITNFAATESGDMQLLTQHYYRGGAKQTNATLERLLQNDDGWDSRLDKLRELCAEHHLAFRINEVNSFSGGGKPGVSDTLGSSIWCLDYMFKLASHGCEGINLETDINQLGFLSHYSPIIHDDAGRSIVRPEYYAMLAFALAGQGELVRTTAENSSTNLSVYATRSEKKSLWLTVINRDMNQATAVSVSLPTGYHKAEVLRLAGPSVESKEHVTLAGAEVSEAGMWRPGAAQKCEISRGVVRLDLPAVSVAVVRINKD